MGVRRCTPTALVVLLLACTESADLTDGSTTDGAATDGSTSDAPADGPVDVAMESPPTCASSAVCVAGDRPVCDPGSKMCRACKDGAECLAKDPARPLCDTTGGACVACLTAAACTTPAVPICDAASKSCRKCTGGAECLAKDPARPVCDAAAGSCHECLADADCQGAGKAAGKPVCDKTTRTCRACAADAECTGMSAALRACLTSGAKTGQCAECDDDAACNADAAKPYCDGADNACRGCRSGAECAAKTAGSLRGCDMGACVECTTAAECMDPAKPICGARKCRACEADDECAAASIGAGVCMLHQDGRCASEAETIYVEDAAGCDNAGMGTFAKPLCNPDPAEDLVTATRRVVVISGKVDGFRWSHVEDGALISVIGINDATVEPTMDIPGINVSGAGMDAFFRAITVQNSPKVGILAEDRAIIRLDGVISRGNGDGGLKTLTSGFDIVNSVFVDNDRGDIGVYGFGGVALAYAEDVSEPKRFAFNTVANNDGVGVLCTDDNYVVLGSVVWNNGSLASQDIWTCVKMATMSSVDGNPQLDASYHLTDRSPCRNTLSGVMTPPRDRDGEKRPMGAMPDCGADEFAE